jgi:hypothetical protein
MKLMTALILTIFFNQAYADSECTVDIRWQSRGLEFKGFLADRAVTKNISLEDCIKLAKNTHANHDYTKVGAYIYTEMKYKSSNENSKLKLKNPNF